MNTSSYLPVNIRPACSADALVAAELLYLSMGELADLMFTVKPGCSSQAVLAELFACGSGRFSYCFGQVAERKGRVLGLLMAFSSAEMFIQDMATGWHLMRTVGLTGLVRIFLRVLPMAIMQEAGRGEYYISNLAVLPRFQGQAVGTQLLNHAEEAARVAGLHKCSLIVDLENHVARRLYERMGYQAVLTKHASSPGNAFAGGYCRMVKHLPTVVSSE